MGQLYGTAQPELYLPRELVDLIMTQRVCAEGNHVDPELYRTMALVNSAFVRRRDHMQLALIRTVKGLTELPNKRLHSIGDIPNVVGTEIYDWFHMFGTSALSPIRRCDSKIVGIIGCHFALRVAGTKVWSENGKFHRKNLPKGSAQLPAVICADGSKFWCHSGNFHRTDGPAAELADWSVHWYVNGQRHREDDLPAYEHPNGTRHWYRRGKLHREHGSAVILADGTEYWFFHGKLHRDILPAVSVLSGSKYWFSHGKLRRSGPAIELYDGSQYWFKYEGAENVWVFDGCVTYRTNSAEDLTSKIRNKVDSDMWNPVAAWVD